jgi:PAS domain S-box-containing protein
MFREVACSGRAGHLETFDSFGGRDSWYGVRAVPFADGVVFSFEDITERKQAEEEERKYREQLAQMLNALPQMAWVYGATGELIFFNERWYAYTGLGEKPSKEQGWQAAVHPSDIDRTRDALVQSTANHTPLELEIRCRRHDGAYRWHLSRAVPILRDDGSVGLWVGTATDIHDLKLAETQLRTMEVSRQKELTHVILEAQEEEKQRISEALHNGLAQQLYAVRLQLENVQLEPHPEKLADSEAAKRKTEALLLEAIHQTRELSHELSPAMLEDYGLQEAIEHFCRNLTHQGLRLRCRFEDLPSRLEKPLEIAIYRISQELATNIVKHAQASGASILIRQDHKRISLEARDNGVGFAPGKPNQKGLGLRAIENRVKLLGGTLSIESVPDEGTLIRIQMPWGQPGA